MTIVVPGFPKFLKSLAIVTLMTLSSASAFAMNDQEDEEILRGGTLKGSLPSSDAASSSQSSIAASLSMPSSKELKFLSSGKYISKVSLRDGLTGLYTEKQKRQLEKKKTKLPNVSSFRRQQLEGKSIYFFTEGDECKIIGKHHEYLLNAVPEIKDLKRVYNFVAQHNEIAKSENLPTIVQYRGSIKVEEAPIILLDKAEGASLHRFFDSDSEIAGLLSHAYNIGLQLGNFYAKYTDADGVVLHGDAHLENIFYDKEDHRVWMIDTSSISKKPIDCLKSDLNNLFNHAQPKMHQNPFFYLKRGSYEANKNDIERKILLLTKMKEGFLEGIKNNVWVDPHQKIQPLLDSYIENSYNWMLGVLNRTF
jgi:hypothetical protein